MKRVLLIFVVLVIVLLSSCSASATTQNYITTGFSNTSSTLTSVHTSVSSTTQIQIKLTIMGTTSYTDESGYFNVVGEVLNSGGSNIKDVMVVATFYDGSNKVIGTAFTYTELDIIPANISAPFDILTYPNKIQPASYKLAVQGNVTGIQPFAGLSTNNSSASIDGSGYFDIVGEVDNASTQPANAVKVIATYYDSSNNVIGMGFTYTTIDVIEAGNISPFDLTSYPLKINPSTYKLQVQGQ